MGFWQFVRRSKKVAHTQNPTDEKVDEKMAHTRKGSRDKKVDRYGGAAGANNKLKRRRTDKAAAVPETSSFPLRSSTAIPASAIPIAPPLKDHPALRNNVKLYEQKPWSDSSLGQEQINVFHAPTLHGKRSGMELKNETGLLRRRSSKRKADDQAREREVRAMGSPIPIPQRHPSQTETPLRRDTKKVPNRLSKRSGRYSSDISLPIPESLSDLGVSSTANSYEVRTMDILHPKPTLRYSSNPRTSHTKARDAPQQMIVEEDYHSRRKIDDLADDLDAKALRELMERDQRRRERKGKTDQARLEQKLKRRAEHEKHKHAEKCQTEAIENVTQPGLAEAKARREGREKATPSPTDPFSDTAVAQPPELRIPSPEQLKNSTSAKDSRAAVSPISPSSSIQQTPTRTSISQVTALPLEPTETKKSRRASGHGNRNSFTSLFRRSTQAEKRQSTDRGRHASPDTPRDSKLDSPTPTSQMVGARTYRRSGTPQRTQTQSRFKEDLPELPISPPDSRVQSPEVGSDQSEGAVKSSKGTPEKPNDHPQTSATATGAPLSEQLASVDAEATWLSGKPTKKPSVRRENPLKAKTDTNQASRNSTEDTDVTNDPYFRALSLETGENEKTSVTPTRKASSTALNVDDESEAEATATQGRPPLPTGNEKWHSSVGKHPQLVRQPAQARSKEGLLKEYRAHEGQTGIFEDETSELYSPDMDDMDAGTSAPILRAQSVNYGGPGHARHISAGSAKLLDIHPTDSKRSSMQRSEKVPTPNRAAFTAEDIQKRL